MHILLSTIGSIGDVIPFLEVGFALQRRGHEVQILANPAFESRVREAELNFVPVGRLSDQERILNHPHCWSRIRGWSLWLRLLCLPTMRPMYQAIERLHRPGETVQAFGWGCFGARIAQETLGIPSASIFLEPDKFRTGYDTIELPLRFLNRDWHPPALRRSTYWLLDRGFVDHFLFKVNQFRKELGLPKQKRLLHEWWLGPDLALALFPDWWAAAQPDWPEQVVTTGFPLGELGTRESLSEELQEFVDQGEPPVVFTPGALNRQSASFFHSAAQACVRLGTRGVLLGDRKVIPDSLPPGVRHFDYAPFNALFPRASVVVHRAGIGTVIQAMAAARPQVVLPTLYLQHDTARRMERLGLGTTLSWHELDASRLAEAVRSVRDSSEITKNVRLIAQKMQEDSPLEATCDLLEQLRPEGIPAAGPHWSRPAVAIASSSSHSL
jgi:rhamnosyltransferase subunit B